MSDFVERDPQSNPGQPTLQRSALDMCAGIIVGPPPEAIEIPRRDTLLTRPWVHQEMHEQMPGLPVALPMASAIIAAPPSCRQTVTFNGRS